MLMLSYSLIRDKEAQATAVVLSIFLAIPDSMPSL